MILYHELLVSGFELCIQLSMQ